MSAQIKKDVVIVGGGLAGLTVASKLSKEGKKVVILEKSILGGRAITMDLKGFSFNFGAHAIYARDKSMISLLEKELKLALHWVCFNKDKAKYDLGTELSTIPSDILGLFQTKMVNGFNKVKFVWFILNTMFNLYKGDEQSTIKEWLEEKKVDDETQRMLLTLASSNFFTNEPENILAKDFFQYYNLVFKTKEPVSYLRGGWRTIIDEMKRVIEENDGEIKVKTKVNELNISEGIVQSINTKDDEYIADHYVFCIPPNELKKLFENSSLEEKINQYATFEPSYVMYYDIGLSNCVDTELAYVYDEKEKIFITDISAYDKTCVPEGGQLLQAISYINQKDLENENYFEEKKEKIERLYDKHFKGWRESLVVPRISKKAVVQEIKSKKGQVLMPISFEEIKNTWFAGDWCQGKGQLSELSFSSGYGVAKKIIQN